MPLRDLPNQLDLLTEISTFRCIWPSFWLTIPALPYPDWPRTKRSQRAKAGTIVHRITLSNTPHQAAVRAGRQSVCCLQFADREPVATIIYLCGVDRIDLLMPQRVVQRAKADVRP